MGLVHILEQDLEKEEVVTPAYHKGLTTAEAEDRLKRLGKNALKERKRISPAKIFFNQYKDILTIILLVSTVISIILGEYVEAIAIAVIVLLNGVMGFLQEYKTEKTLENLKKLSAPTAKVYRDGRLIEIPAEDIVRGDVLKIRSGDRVCADCMITENHSLSADESILTGESQAVTKQVSVSLDKTNELHREDVLYMGTIVTLGHGEACVIATGMDTQMGHIAGMLHQIEEEQTQLQKKLAQLGKYIAIGCLIICTLVAVTGALRGEAILDMLIMGLSLAVAAVPEGLPAIVTIALALAVGRMVKQKALVRKLHAVETLGCTNVICSDKTGTLTQNKMTVTKFYHINGMQTYEPKQVFDYNTIAYKMALCSVLCNNTLLEDNAFVGEPTEIALMKFGTSAAAEISHVLRDYHRLDENPFDSKRKCMSVVVEDITGKRMLYAKGALDFLIEKCTHIRTEQGAILLSSEYRKEIFEMNDRMASNALRVIALAEKPLNSSGNKDESELVFLGLVGMIDPPRPEAKKAVSTCQNAGIKTIMITGDHRLTACAIATEIGIYRQGDYVLEGKEIETMSSERLEQLVGKTTVFARVSPKHKLMIVEALEKNGNVVAMTGDGVNDAPAIKQADIGVGMGTGTDVTKEASDIVLLDDNFATLVHAVREGRVIYSNIRKFIRYLLSCNIGEVMTMFLGMLMGMPVILLPIQILMVNLVTDGLPAIALGLEPAEKDVMNKRPRKKNDGIFSDGLLSKIVFRGIFIGLSTLATFVMIYRMTGDVATGQTGAYFTLVITQLINVFECKNEKHGLFSVQFLNNKKLIGAVLISLLILFATIYLKPLQFILNTVSLSSELLFVAAGFCIIPSVTSLVLNERPKKSEKMVENK